MAQMCSPDSILCRKFGTSIWNLENNTAASSIAIATVTTSADAALAACLGVLFVVDDILRLHTHMYDIRGMFTEATLCRADG